MSNFTFTIGEIAVLLGITPKTIRHYHKIGLVTQPRRDDSNYRVYDLVQLTELQQILRLKQFGLSLKQIEIIIKSDNPGALIAIVLQQHANTLRMELSRLQQQLAATQDFLNQGSTLSGTRQPDKPPVSSLAALSDAVKPRSSGVSDILVEFERDAMGKLDTFAWGDGYEHFWHQAGRRFIDLLTDEGLFIFWIERYLALAAMEAEDLQGNAWIQELTYSPARQMLRQSFIPLSRITPVMPAAEQERLVKLLPFLLYQGSSPLQRHFLSLLL
jgi:DNA-binding transcriptional MerR regulator